MRIGELSRQAGCPVETIRYYEREGLLSVPERSAGNYRLYRRTHLDQLRFIRNCRSLDMPLAEIRQLLVWRQAPHAGCREVNALMDAQIDKVAQRIAELQELQAQLQRLRHSCPGNTDCRILLQLGQEPAVEGADGVSGS